MALTAAQINDIAVAIGMTPTLLNAHITSLGATLTADIETKVLAQLTRYSSGTVVRDIWFTPTESNEGLNTNRITNADNTDPRNNIRLLLEIPYDYWPSSANYNSIPVCV